MNSESHMDPSAGLNVGHLLQLQRDLTATIREELAATKGELRTDIANTRQDLHREIGQVKAKQDITNGRTSRLERVTAALRLRVDARSTIWSSLSKTQKAKLAAGVALIGPMAFELLQRVLPILLAMLTRAPAPAIGEPVPLPLPLPVAERPAPKVTR
jgi:hypothetical protein